jgi:hypothetical protein
VYITSIWPCWNSPAIAAGCATAATLGADAAQLGEERVHVGLGAAERLGHLDQRHGAEGGAEAGEAEPRGVFRPEQVPPPGRLGQLGGVVGDADHLRGDGGAVRVGVAFGQHASGGQPRRVERLEQAQLDAADARARIEHEDVEGSGAAGRAGLGDLVHREERVERDRHVVLGQQARRQDGPQRLVPPARVDGSGQRDRAGLGACAGERRGGTPRGQGRRLRRSMRLTASLLRGTGWGGYQG